MKHLHCRVSATADVCFEHILDHCFRVDIQQIYTRTIVDQSSTVADTRKSKCFAVTINKMMNYFCSHLRGAITYNCYFKYLSFSRATTSQKNLVH